jgi:hypothetical protein
VVAKDNPDTYLLGKADLRAEIGASVSFRDQLYRIYFLRH